MICRILLTAFSNTSAEWLLSSVKGYDILLLPSNKEKDCELLTDRLISNHYDVVICIGQRPNIKDKVHIEMSAKEENVVISTSVNCEKLAELFEEHLIHTKISKNAGTSYCNALYYRGLQMISVNNWKMKLVFVHIPFYKNLSNPSMFKKRFIEIIDELKVGESRAYG